MTELNEIYKCEICGNIVQMIHGGPGELVCCGQPMVLLDEQTAEMKLEKHVPVIERDGDLVKVYVGSTQHPMEENHHIEWVEILTPGGGCRKFLNAGDAPEADFGADMAAVKSAREYCNVHGLWKKD